MTARARSSEGHLPAEDEVRVCPSCGRRPGAGIHCEHCGSNLFWRRRLPARYRWRESSRQASPSLPADRLRYLPRELRDLHRGTGETERGWLMLTLALNEDLRSHEQVVCIFSAAKPAGVHWWLVRTTERLLCIPGWSVAFFDRGSLRAYELGAIEDARTHRRIFGSLFSFKDAGGERVRFSMRGRGTAREVIEALPAPDPP